MLQLIPIRHVISGLYPAGVRSNPLFKLNFKRALTSHASLKIILVHVHELAQSREKENKSNKAYCPEKVSF